jgi:hypothetical protein
MAEVEEKEPRHRPKLPKGVVEHARAARAERRAALKALIPDSFWAHQKAAKKETLLAFRSLIDAALEELEKPAEK